jgi:hypothetical protein
MKTFSTLRQSLQEKVVYNKKMGRIPVVITNVSKGFELKIDGDIVDVLKTQKDAEDTAKQILKDLGKL